MNARVILHDPQAGDVCHDLSGGVITIGRHSDSTIQIDQPSVSSRHAELHCSGSAFRFTDCGSTNGSWVNGQRISSVELRDGDGIRLGEIEATYLINQVSEPALAWAEANRDVPIADELDTAAGASRSGSASHGLIRKKRLSPKLVAVGGVFITTFLLALRLLFHKHETPESLLREYLAAKEWRDRLKYVTSLQRRKR